MNRILTNLFSICLCVLPALIHAQDAILQGVITDSNNSDPLIAATLEANGEGTVSDYEGNYKLSLAAGTHLLQVSYIGYESKEISITLAAGEERTLHIQMGESATLLQTATISSGRYEKPLGEATVSLDVIKPDLIENNNSISVDDVLNKVPGVNIIDGQANIRGGSGYSYGAGSRVMLLIDDIPALQADAGRPNWDDIPVENVAQIEVIKGAASALYGSAALNGIVNVRTQYATSKPVTKASLFYTGYSAPKDELKHWWRDTTATPLTTGLSLAHRQKFGKLDLVSSAYFLYQDRWNKETWEHRGRVTLGLRYRLTDKLNFGVNTIVNSGNNSNFFYWTNASEGALIGNPGSFSKNSKTRFTIDPFVSYADEQGNRHKFLGRLYGVDNSLNNNQSNQSYLYYGEYQYQRKWEATGLVLTTGLVGSTTRINAVLYGGNGFKSENAAAYAQVERKFFDKLNLTGGVRYEYNNATAPDSIAMLIENPDATEGKPIFRLGMNYQITDYTFLRASWGQGYRYPTIAEKFISTNVGFQILPNYDLESETGWSTEIGLKQGFRISEWEGFFDVALFWSQYQNMMEFALASGFAFSSQNVGDTDIKGIDLSVMGQGKLGPFPTTLIAGFSHINPTFQEFTRKDSLASSADYNILKYRYKTTWKFDIESRMGAFSLGLAGFYNSNMEAIDFTFEGFIPGLRDYRATNNTGSTVFDARFGYYFGKNKLSFLAKNLFNTEYTLRPALIEAPRNFTVKFERTF